MVPRANYRRERFEAMSVGAHHACGLRADGETVCWGWDEYGQSSPPPGERFESVGVGAHHACGLRVGRGGGVLGAVMSMDSRARRRTRDSWP